MGWGSTECFCLLCSLSTQSLFAAVHPLLPPLSFLRGLWCFPSCMLLFLDASPEPSVEAEAHFTQCCTCCSASLGTAQLLSASLTYRGGEDPAPPSPVNDFRLLSWTESHSAIREGSLIDPQRGFPSTYTWCHPEGDAGAPPGALLWQRLTLLCPTLQCNENIQKYLPWPLPTQLSHTGAPLPSHLSGRHQAPKAGSCFYHPQPSPPSLLHLATFCAPFNPI